MLQASISNLKNKLKEINIDLIWSNNLILNEKSKKKIPRFINLDFWT